MKIAETIYNLATDKYRGFIPGLCKFFLLILSFIYGVSLAVVRFFSRIKPCRLDCRVISVGNITLGGTGKTALVEYIAAFLAGQGRKVAVLSRGAGYSQVLLDEPRMLRSNLQGVAVVADRDRVRGAKQAVSGHGCDTVIMDDGFQQWKIRKDLEIVAIDAARPFGNFHLLPRGILREPIAALKRADILVLTKTNLKPDIRDTLALISRINRAALIVESRHQPIGFYALGRREDLKSLTGLRGRKAVLFSGIGDPGSFENLVVSLGVEIGMSLCFPDHYQYTRGDIERIIREARDKGIDTVMTTEKDAARLSAYAAECAGFLALRVKIEITKNEELFHRRLLRLYGV